MRTAAYARAFARALHGAASDNGVTEVVAQETDALLQQWRASPELRSFCRDNPSAGASMRMEAVESIWGTSVSPLLTHFLKLLAQRGHLALLPQIFLYYHKLYDRARGCSRVSITFAAPPGESQVERIRKLVAKAYGPTMRIESRVDSELIAGVKFFVNDKLVDASLAGRLERLRAGLLRPMQQPGTGVT